MYRTYIQWYHPFFQASKSACILAIMRRWQKSEPRTVTTSIADCYDQVKNGGLEVNLSCRNLGDEDAEHIAKALMDPNTKVPVLYFRGNKMEKDNAMAFAEALKLNSTLQEIWLDYNHIGMTVQGSLQRY
jgi:hypothetical protein